MHMLYSLVSMLEWFGLIPTLESFRWAIAIFKLMIGGKMLLAPLILPIPPLSWSLRCLSYGGPSRKQRIIVFYVNCDATDPSGIISSSPRKIIRS